jgi:hypothetical protein
MKSVIILTSRILMMETKMAINYKEKSSMLIDKSTGEILRNETLIEYETKLPNEPPYIKLYTTDLGDLCGLSPIGKNVLLKLVTMADYDGEILLPRGKREKIATELKSSLGAINNAITEIAKVEIIVREGSSGSGVYKLNPMYMARGKWRDIYEQRKAFKLTITYSHDENGGKREVLTEQIGADILQFPATEGEIS